MSRYIGALTLSVVLAGCAVGPYRPPGRLGDNKYELAYGADRLAAMIQIDRFCADKGFTRASPIKDFGAAVTFSCVK
jgi:hypothetical protein